MNSVEVYILEINFPIAFFKVPYTVKTRKSYLIPRKKAILSLFNAFFEEPISFWRIRSRNKKDKLIKEEEILNNYLVGGELLYFEKTSEIQRIIQIKRNSVERPPSETELLTNVVYRFYLIASIDIRIKINPINYYPYAGQNDYLAYSWKINKVKGNILEKYILYLNNYQLVPVDLIDFSKSKIEILIENALEKYVIVKGDLVLTNKVRILNLEKDSSDIILF